MDKVLGKCTKLNPTRPFWISVNEINQILQVISSRTEAGSLHQFDTQVCTNF